MKLIFNACAVAVSCVLLSSACFAHPLNDKGYTLDKVVILSRHNIRAPLSSPESDLGKMSAHGWTQWSSKPGELSMRGGQVETLMGQYFRKYLADAKFMEENYVPSDGEFRFYSNAMQRTIATAKFFSAALLPVANVNVEYHGKVGDRDHVFLPILTYMSDSYQKLAHDQIASLNGGDKGFLGIDEKIQDNLRILETTLDYNASAYAKEHKLKHLSVEPTDVVLKLGDEPTMKGLLNTAFTAADAFVMQSYEVDDPVQAAFGHNLSEEEFDKILQINDIYQNVLFKAPLVSANTANPILREMFLELNQKNRRFTFLCGHDSTIMSLLSALSVKPYELKEAASKETAIGVKLCIERWTDKNGEQYADVYMTYPSNTQIHQRNEINLKDPPMKQQLEFDGISRQKNGLFLYQDVVGKFEKSILAYDEIVKL